MTKKALKVNTASGATLGLIGIVPLKLNINDQNLKEHLNLGLYFTQRCRIRIDWNMY